MTILIPGSSRAVEETRLFGNLGYDSRLSRLKYPTDDPLADAVAPPPLLAGGKPIGSLDGDLPALAIEQGQASPDDPLVFGDDFQNRAQGVPEVHARIQSLADIEQQ